jgi:hypothetical protein
MTTDYILESGRRWIKPLSNKLDPQMSHSEVTLKRYPLCQTMIPRPTGGQKTKKAGCFAAVNAAKHPAFLFIS